MSTISIIKISILNTIILKGLTDLKLQLRAKESCVWRFFEKLVVPRIFTTFATDDTDAEGEMDSTRELEREAE